MAAMEVDLVMLWDGGSLVVRLRGPNEEYHRIVFEPGDDIDARMAGVNSTMRQLGFSDVSGVERIKAAASECWTKELIAAAKKRSADTA